jgi:hypothetical protein
VSDDLALFDGQEIDGMGPVEAVDLAAVYPSQILPPELIDENRMSEAKRGLEQRIPRG